VKLCCVRSAALSAPRGAGTNFVFNNVVLEGEFIVSKDYVCKNVQGVATNSTPAPACF
jgi:hypothetical protein